MSTIVIYDRDTRIAYDTDAAAEQALSEHLGRPVTIRGVQAEAARIAREEHRTGYPAVTHS